MFFLAQAFGVVAVVFELISYQCRKKRNMLWCDVFATIFYGVQYFLLGATSGAWVQVLVLTRTLCVLAKDQRKKEWNWLFFLFVVAYIIVGILTFEAWYSILSVLASLIFLIATWKFQDAQKIRYLALPAKGLWLIYNICVISIPGIIANVFNIVSIGVGLWRNRQKPQKKKRQVQRKKKS